VHERRGHVRLDLRDIEEAPDLRFSFGFDHCPLVIDEVKAPEVRRG
jgi:hypothetical protein